MRVTRVPLRCAHHSHCFWKLCFLLVLLYITCFMKHCFERAGAGVNTDIASKYNQSNSTEHKFSGLEALLV